MLFGLVFQVRNDFRISDHISSNITECFTESTRDDIHLVKSIEHFNYASARIANDSNAVGVVDNQVTTVFVGEISDLIQFGYITILAVYAIYDYHFRTKVVLSIF